MDFHFGCAVFVVLFAGLLLAECSVESAEETARSARWDAYRANKRQRRNTPTMEWQNRRQFPNCTLSDLTTFDALGRRAAGLLATPQSQGRCGSCWAFAATHVYTDHLSLQFRSRVPVFSQDFLTQCISPYRNRSQAVGNGCCGGNAHAAFGYLQEFGAVSEACRPYTLGNYSSRDRENKERNPLVCPQSCVSTSRGASFSPSRNRIPGFTALQTEDVITALNQSRPVYARMEARDAIKFDYRCGVFCDAPIRRPNHAVEIVDYSNPNYTGSPYWVVKNSWGDTWGEGGYFRIARGLIQLTGFATITASDQTSLPDATPDLTASTCDPQAPNDESDNELIDSAVEFAIERLNNMSGVQCAGDSTAVATLSLSSVVNATVQVIEGAVVQAMAEVTVEGCTEDTATITFTVVIDLDENFSLAEFSDYTASTTSTTTSDVTATTSDVTATTSDVTATTSDVTAGGDSFYPGHLTFFTLVISMLTMF